MIKISAEDEKFIYHNIPNAVQYLKAQDLRGLLGELDDTVLARGYDGRWGDGINDFGRQIERIIDRVYYDNTTQE